VGGEELQGGLVSAALLCVGLGRVIKEDQPDEAHRK